MKANFVPWFRKHAPDNPKYNLYETIINREDDLVLTDCIIRKKDAFKNLYKHLGFSKMNDEYYNCTVL